MSEFNKTYRINTEIDGNAIDRYITIDTDLVQDYEVFDILSIKLNSADIYKLHNSNYGVVVGRVLANNGFGVPNAKLSIFIEADSYDGKKVRELYPFVSTYSKDTNNIKYNLLPNEKVANCHQKVGTFPNKRYLLDNDIIIEVFDKYYKYTTRTNNAGDYLIMGVPVGNHVLHMDLDLSDCGILSQRPRDFVYKGYTIEQFENPNMFKTSDNFNELSQVFTQDQTVNVQPFWGDSNSGEQIGITRTDINVSFTFQPTCVFLGCVASDNSSQGITKKCMATENMGNMEELTTGEGTIEMIRKTPSGDIEEFQIKGTQLIDSNGVWCYQIPMNLDYMMTDEYGNMVPTDDPSKGIPTRCSARFRVSMQDNEENVDNYFRAKVLVPHNPQNLSDGKYEDYDYEFGSKTRDDSFRDLFWNNVYTVKSYIPRFQKRMIRGWKDKRFTGIKSCNFFGGNNPMPYNNIRIRLPFMFTVMCAITKCLIFFTGIFNTLISALGNFLAALGLKKIDLGWFGTIWLFPKAYGSAIEMKLNVLSEGLCPDLENWFFAPMLKNNLVKKNSAPPGYSPYNLLAQTIKHLQSDNAYDDEQSIEYQNKESEDDVICLTINVDYLIACVEMNLAMEYKVINFDFYNDWINGLIYIPRFMRYVRPKKTFLGITIAKTKIKGCMDNVKTFSKTRRYTQQCALGYGPTISNNKIVYSSVDNPLGKSNGPIQIKRANNLHKGKGLVQKTIFGRNGGVCHEHTTSKGHNVYYMKPCEWTKNSNPSNVKTILFATDLVLLGSLNDCDQNGLPQAFKYLSSTSYIMPTNLALTNMETNGPLYANDKGTICSGNGGQLPNDNTIPEDDGIKVIPIEDGLTGEIKYYKEAADSNIEVEYEGNELSDIIALTEAAGIAWNYTGPGQGAPNPKKLYYPGGHFLGLTCTNSQTNIKSCVNLERICEVGANMSQRKEDVREVTKDGELLYVYTTPTGFISGDDIVAEDFRTMFSTLNKRRLIADKVNPLTGYKIYDFEYIHPINFDGSFKNVVNKNESYNKFGELVPIEDNSTFAKVGINSNINNHPDGDINESAYTQTRTIEDYDIDYYLFRFGLNRDDLKKNGELQVRKFLKNKNNRYYLPQYENSFYFYFGMKDGASAIDEFNKQFFSVCETERINMGEPSMELILEDMDLCNGTQDINIIIDNMETPYNSLTYTIEGDTTEKDGVYTLTVYDVLENPELSYNNIIKLENKDFGTYTFTIIDAEGISLTKTVNVGGDILSADIKVHDFNVSDYTLLERFKSVKSASVDILGASVNTIPEDTILGAVSIECTIKDLHDKEVIRRDDCFSDEFCSYNTCGDCSDCSTFNDCKTDCSTHSLCDRVPNKPIIIVPGVNLICREDICLYDNTPTINSEYMFEGGYFTIENLKVNDKYKDSITKTRVTIVGVNENINEGQRKETIDGFAEIPVLSGNVIYDIYLGYKTSEECSWQDIYYASYKVDDGSSVSLNMGWKNLDIYTPITSTSPYLRYGTDNWWNSIDDNLSNNDVLQNDWIKKVCTFKETNSATTFSNNIFASNGIKVLWGTPQNSTGVLKISDKKTIFNSESGDYDKFENYTLDDDYSYFTTIPQINDNVHYSAIAVNGTTVSGDFWATLKDGVTSWLDENKKFPINSGYVFKPLPEGNLQYHVYNANEGLKYFKYEYIDGTTSDTLPKVYENNEEYFEESGGNIIKNGIFYPSFIYPVIGAPFSVDIDFYVWERKILYNEEGSTEINYSSETFAGRTELSLKNGISCGERNTILNETKTNFHFNKALISNIKQSSFNTDFSYLLNEVHDINVINKDRVLIYSGMNPHVIEIDEDENMTIDDSRVAYLETTDGTIAMGESGITEMYYNIIEGTPTSMTKMSNSSTTVSSETLETLVSSLSNNIYIEDIFSDKIVAKEYGGGIYDFYRGDSKKPYDFANPKGDVKLYICSNSNFVFSPHNNNERFIYLKGGSSDKPEYWVLCTYNENATGNKLGDFVTLHINYINRNRFSWEIPYVDTNESSDTYGGIIYQTGSTERDSDYKGYRNNLAQIIRTIQMLQSEPLKATPVGNKVINVYPSNVNSWYECIENSIQNDIRKIGDVSYLDLNGDSQSRVNLTSFYAVETFETETLNGKVRVSKIFPIITEKQTLIGNVEVEPSLNRVSFLPIFFAASL
jgi:hypothetical protein